MSISYQFGDVDAHGAMIRSQAASLESEHQSIVRDVLAAGDFWGGSGSVACQEFITQLGRNFQVIYEQANSHGQKVQTAGNNMSSTDSAVGVQLGLTPHEYCGPHTRRVCGPQPFLPLYSHRRHSGTARDTVEFGAAYFLAHHCNSWRGTKVIATQRYLAAEALVIAFDA